MRIIQLVILLANMVADKMDDKNIILSIGKYLQDNVVCSDTDVQHFIVVDRDDVYLPLKNVRENLEFLVLCGFLEKHGDKLYSPKYFQYVKSNSEQLFDQLPIKMWQRI